MFETAFPVRLQAIRPTEPVVVDQVRSTIRMMIMRTVPIPMYMGVSFQSPDYPAEAESKRGSPDGPTESMPARVTAPDAS